MKRRIFRTTKEEREIIFNLDNDQNEAWAKQGEFWRIYRAVIKATKEHFGVGKGGKDGKN